MAHESIDGALVVKTLGREDAETARLAEQGRGAARRAGRGGDTFGPRSRPRLDALPALGSASCSPIGRVAGLDAAPSRPATLVGFVALFGLLAWPMRFIGWILAELPRAVVGYARLEEVFAQRASLMPPEHPVALPDGPARDRGPRRGATCSTTSHGPARRCRSTVEPDGVGRDRGRRPASARAMLAQLMVRLADPDERRGARRRRDVRGGRPGGPAAATSRSCSRRASCSPRRSPENIALDTGATEADVVARPAMIAERGPVRPRAAEGLRHRGRRARPHALRRPAPAGRAGAGPGARAPRADPRRRHEQRRPHDRGRDPRRRCAASCRRR